MTRCKTDPRIQESCSGFRCELVASIHLAEIAGWSSRIASVRLAGGKAFRKGSPEVLRAFELIREFFEGGKGTRVLHAILHATRGHPVPHLHAWALVLVVVASILAGCGVSFAQGNSSGRPTYESVRQNEDWSVLAKIDRLREADSFDALKYVPLTESGSTWVSFGGQIRERVEGWNQFNFGAPVSAVHNDAFLLSRLMLHADLHLGSKVRIFVQEKNAFSTHRALYGGQRTNDVDELDLQNGFVEVKLPFADTRTLTFRAGRQELSFGKERFVGVSDWSNTRRTWDGFSGAMDNAKATLIFFWARPVRVAKYAFNLPDSGTQFYGVHLNRKLPAKWGIAEMYWYGLNNRLAAYNGTTGSENRHVLGGHSVNRIGKSGFDYDLGGSVQVGSVGVHSILAYGAVTQLGYTLRKRRGTPRFYVGYDYASGDRQRGGNVGTFNLLYPTAHGTLGYADIVGRQNLIDLNGGVALNPARKWRVRFDAYSYWRASANDALYDKRGTVVRQGFPGSSRKTGDEVDATVRYQFDVHTTVQLGYSHFFPGDFVKQSGPHAPVDFVYTMLQFTF